VCIVDYFNVLTCYFAIVILKYVFVVKCCKYLSLCTCGKMSVYLNKPFRLSKSLRDFFSKNCWRLNVPSQCMFVIGTHGTCYRCFERGGHRFNSSKGRYEISLNVDFVCINEIDWFNRRCDCVSSPVCEVRTALKGRFPVQAILPLSFGNCLSKKLTTIQMWMKDLFSFYYVILLCFEKRTEFLTCELNWILPNKSSSKGWVNSSALNKFQI